MKGPKTLTSSQTNTGTTTTSVDPTQTARQNDIWTMANGLGYTPYTGQRFEDFNPDQQAAFAQGRTAATAGQGELDQATGILGGLGGFNAPTVNYTGTGDPRLIKAQQIGLGALGGGFNPGSISARDVTAERGPGGYQAYMSPFENDVVSAALGDINRQQGETQNAIRLRQAAEGAFGGSRSGVEAAGTNRAYGDLAARTAAELRSQGFNTALGYNAADQNRALQAAMANQGADVATGTANLNARTTAGLANQDVLARILQGNQNADLTGQMANQNAFQRAGEFNAGNQLTADTTNAGNAIAGAGLRMNAGMGLGALGQQRQNMLGQGADLLSRIGGAQQALGQANRDFNYQQFTEGRDFPAQKIDLLSRILGQSQFGSTTRQTGTSTSTQPNPNRGSFFNNLLGIGAGLLPFGGAIKSGLGSLFGGGGQAGNQGLPPELMQYAGA